MQNNSEEKKYNNKKNQNQIMLTEDEKKNYGDRCPNSYKKTKILGKGGFSVVWQGKINQQAVAMKQIIKSNGQTGNDSYLKELKFYNLMFGNNNLENQQQIKQQQILQKQMNRGQRSISNNSVSNQSQNQDKSQMSSSNQKNIIDISQNQNQFSNECLTKLVDVINDEKDVWIVSEMGGNSLSSSLFSMKGEFYKGERVYKILFTELYNEIFQIEKNNILKSFITKMADTLLSFNNKLLVHSDLKSENILISIDEDRKDIKSLKIIDYGSNFQFSDKGQAVVTTPEFMPPEVIQFYCSNQSNAYFQQCFYPSKAVIKQLSQIEILSKICRPSSLDIWSLGAILVEMLSGVPNWLSYKSLITNNNDQNINYGKQQLKTGLFSVMGTGYDKLLQKQYKVQENLKQYCQDFMGNFKDQDDAKMLLDLISQMLILDPMQRITPQQILNHPFLIGNQDILISQNDIQLPNN